MLTQDDTYGDYFFPKGTMFFANAWSIHRTAEFESPDDFIPERFMNNKFGVKGDKDVGDDKRRISYGFGAGRRVCSGQRLAENSLVSESRYSSPANLADFFSRSSIWPSSSGHLTSHQLERSMTTLTQVTLVAF
jgi:hypothetical protein